MQNYRKYFNYASIFFVLCSLSVIFSGCFVDKFPLECRDFYKRTPSFYTFCVSVRNGGKTFRSIGGLSRVYRTFVEPFSILTRIRSVDNLAQKWTIWHNMQPSWQNINTQSGILTTRHRSCTTYSEHVQQREPARQTKHLLQQVTQQREMFNLGVDTVTRQQPQQFNPII